MTRRTHNSIIWGGLSAALLGFAIAGCGGNNADNSATSGSNIPPAPQSDTQNATPAGDVGSAGGTAPAELTSFFPGATLTKKAFPMNETAAAHMGEESGVKFNGKEGEWEVYEASQNNQRIGLAVMTHSDLPGGGDMHIAFAVDKTFKIKKTAVSEAPDAAKMQTFITQTVGKTHDAAFKVGKDLKATPDVAPQVAQIAADAVHKGVVILEENFNPTHGDHEHSEGAGHKDDGHAH